MVEWEHQYTEFEFENIEDFWIYFGSVNNVGIDQNVLIWGFKNLSYNSSLI